jgi:hypothetical protein
MGQLAAIGIVKGKPFAPDARMKKILTDAVNVANATARTLNMNPRESEGFAYYPGSAWFNWLFVDGYNFETPPPMVTKDGIKPFPPTGARTLNSRTTMFIGYTGITPAMCMRVTDHNTWSPRWMQTRTTSTVGRLTRSRCRRVSPRRTSGRSSCTTTRPVPCCKRAQPFPKVGSLNYPRPAAVANADGTTTVYFGPKLPAGVKDGNWIQTVAGKGYFVCLRLYSPLEPFFDKTWRPSEIALVK